MKKERKAHSYIIYYRIYNRTGRYYTDATTEEEAVQQFLTEFFWKTKEDIIRIEQTY